MNSKNIALSVIVGLGLGILFAPDKGVNTRKKIFKKGDDYLNDLKFKYGNLVSKTNSTIDSVKSEGLNLSKKDNLPFSEVATEVENKMPEKTKIIF